jgi:hypothetical protein
MIRSCTGFILSLLTLSRLMDEPRSPSQKTTCLVESESECTYWYVPVHHDVTYH